MYVTKLKISKTLKCYASLDYEDGNQKFNKNNKKVFKWQTDQLLRDNKRYHIKSSQIFNRLKSTYNHIISIRTLRPPIVYKKHDQKPIIDKSSSQKIVCTRPLG